MLRLANAPTVNGSTSTAATGFTSRVSAGFTGSGLVSTILTGSAGGTGVLQALINAILANKTATVLDADVKRMKLSC
jgi:hypothetical protein